MARGAVIKSRGRARDASSDAKSHIIYRKTRLRIVKVVERSHVAQQTFCVNQLFIVLLKPFQRCMCSYA